MNWVKTFFGPMWMWPILSATRPLKKAKKEIKKGKGKEGAELMGTFVSRETYCC